MYTAGLLHDIGQLILLNLYPKNSMQAIAINIEQYDDQQLHLAEKKVFGVDHTQLGFELAKIWNFPTVLQQCIRYHHFPDQSSSHELEVACLHVANSIALMNEFESTDINDAPTIQEAALKICNLDEQSMINIAVTSLKLFKQQKDKLSDNAQAA